MFSNNKKSIALVFAMLLAIMCMSVSAERSSGFEASIVLDYFTPQHDLYKELYGSSSFPLNVRVEYVFKRRIGLFTGIRYLSKAGETDSSASLFEESYTTKLTIVSIPLGINWYMGSDKFNPFIGCGGYYHSYTESWDSLEREYKGTKFAFFAQAGIQMRLGDQVSLLLQGSYIPLPTGIDTLFANAINLGGSAAGVGFAYRF